MKYRPEIDGLRALAVVPVILFHAGFELFSGGFVGVDVFFVISGFLITTILIEDIENQRFSIIKFYERRARRILPALFFVMLVCIPFAWMWMLPSQMIDFTQSLVAVSLFVSNILFWRESGYFDAAAEEKPLLHTWSLAVEEQYYVLFPIFLILAWRFGKNRVFWMIVVMAVISLLLSEWGWRNKPIPNFYLAPTRAWELFAGSIAAFIVQKQGVQRNNILALTGLSAIVFSIFFYDESTPFPSLYALVPVLGVVLLVLYADKKTIVAKLLSTKCFVGLGLISYSAYLWHQPFLAFVIIRYGEQQSLAINLALFICLFFFAYLSWKYIETPFRQKVKFDRIFIFSFSVIGMVLFISLGLVGHLKDGLPNRFENNSNFQALQEKLVGNYGLNESCEQDFIEGGECATSENPEILVWGDSFAMHLIPGIISSNESVKLQQATVSQCAPILGYAIATAIYGAQNCIAFNNNVYQYLSSSEVKYVVLASVFGGLYDNQSIVDSKGILHSNGADIIFTQLIELVDKIRKMGKIPVIFTPTPTNGSNLGNCLLLHDFQGKPLGKCDFDKKNILFSRSEVVSKLKSIQSAKIIDLIDLICSNEICNTSLNNIYIYRDEGHLSIEGSRALGEQFDFYDLIVTE